MPQVIIVGAGPTGATLALQLAQRGIAVTLVEAAKDLHRVFRGEGLMPHGLDALDQMGILPLLDHVPHRPIDNWEFIVNSQHLFAVDEPMGASRPCTLIAQPPLLEAIIAQAQAWEGFTYLSGTPVKDLLWDSEEKGRIMGVVLADGQEIHGDLVIGADGRNSVVRAKAGLELVKEPIDITVLWFKLPAHPKFVEKNTFCSIVTGKNSFSVFHGASQGKLHLGWVLTDAESEDWKHQNWSEIFAKASPAWLADHFRQHKDAIEPPIKLTVVVGRAPLWHTPGLVLLGDAAHPMSPIRAQGINMALRDVIVATNHLVPALQTENLATLDQALGEIQAEREPEIIRAQELQQLEGQQGQKLRNNPWQQLLLKFVGPLVQGKVRESWIARQQPMRLGISEVKLTV